MNLRSNIHTLKAARGRLEWVAYSTNHGIIHERNVGKEVRIGWKSIPISGKSMGKLRLNTEKMTQYLKMRPNTSSKWESASREIKGNMKEMGKHLSMSGSLPGVALTNDTCVNSPSCMQLRVGIFSGWSNATLRFLKICDYSSRKCRLYSKMFTWVGTTLRDHGRLRWTTQFIDRT